MALIVSGINIATNHVIDLFISEQAYPFKQKCLLLTQVQPEADLRYFARVHCN